LSLSKDPVSRPDLAEVIIERPFTELKEKEALCRERLREAQHELQSYAKYSHALHRDILKQLDSFDRSQAVDSADAPMGGLFSAQAWVPENKVMLLETLPAAAMEIAIEDGDRVPTYLDNEKWNRVGEDVIGIYDTPSASDKDPSLWVLASFAVFFAFIVGDGGYGAIYLALSLWVKYKNPALSGLKKRILNLAILLSSACIIWGLCTNSFFGMSLDLEHPMRKFSMVTRLAEKKAEYLISEQNIEYAKWVAQYPGLELSSKGWDFLKNDEILGSFSDTILLELSLFFGIIHVLLGMGRYLKKNPVNIGWMIFLVGAALYFPVYLGGSSLLNYAVGIPFEKGGEIGLYMIGGGIAIAWGLSIYRNGWTGSLEIMNLIQVFADILSYLRLYALGLAGAILGSTINQMAAELPLMIGIFLAIVSHGINMVLGIMGGVIHGLRLNFLEWYHYSLEGGGKKFKPLSLNKLD
jgi:V/A-type H+-transporting ATPase subunit I